MGLFPPFTTSIGGPLQASDAGVSTDVLLRMCSSGCLTGGGAKSRLTRRPSNSSLDSESGSASSSDPAELADTSVGNGEGARLVCSELSGGGDGVVGQDSGGVGGMVLVELLLPSLLLLTLTTAALLRGLSLWSAVGFECPERCSLAGSGRDGGSAC